MMPGAAISKICKRCREAKSESDFHKNKRMKDGLAAFCKACNKAHARAWYQANKDRGQTTRREYHRKNRDKNLVLMAKYRLNNKEAVAKSQKAWRSANSDRKRQNDLNWQKTHPTKMLAYRKVSEHRRRAAKRSSSGQYTAAQIQDLHVKHKMRCACCRKSIKNKFEIDHIMPLSKGGDNTIRNIQLLCPPCNRRKSAKHPIAFMQEQGFLL